MDWSLFFLLWRVVIGRFRQSFTSLHPPYVTLFLREPLTRPRPATLYRSLPISTNSNFIINSLYLCYGFLYYFKMVDFWSEFSHFFAQYDTFLLENYRCSSYYHRKLLNGYLPA